MALTIWNYYKTTAIIPLKWASKRRNVVAEGTWKDLLVVSHADNLAHNQNPVKKYFTAQKENN